MTIQREKQLDEITELLLSLERSIEADKFLQHQNSCIELEYFFRDLLNLVYGWQLVNANALFGKNQDSFDLSDEKNSLAVQVTVTTTAEKIHKTLKNFIGTHDDSYERLVFVYPKITVGHSSADFSADLKGYDFDPARDRLGFGDILCQAQNMTVDNQSRLLDFLRKELRHSPANESRSYPQAFDYSAHGHMLRRERLSRADLESGQAVKPRLLDRVAKAVTERKSIAVEGAPGYGKSSLAAWANWISLQNGQQVATFLGRELQHMSAHDACKGLEHVPDNHLLIVDDIHLIGPALARLKSLAWSADRQFMLLGRTDYVGKAMRRGDIPKMDEDLFIITDEESRYVAEELARKYLPNDEATELLCRTDSDLVLTKWLLEAVVVDGADPNSTPAVAASEKLKDLRRDADAGDEALRLFLTLAAFGWIELPCPESFLSEVLGFSVDAIEELHGRLEEAERYSSTAQEDGIYALRLRRHPKLCRLFLDSAPSLGQTFKVAVAAPTCAALATDANLVESLGLSSVVLGRGLEAGIVDVDTIEWRLKYATRSPDFRDVVMATVQFLLTEYAGPTELALEEKIRRLKFAFAAANAERRVHYATAGQALLDKLQTQLGVPEIPEEQFWDKGYIFYQRAYLYRLNDSFDDAIASFERSASADDEFAWSMNSDIHRGKAAMSRIAAAACRTDAAVFAWTEARLIEPNRGELQSVMNGLSNELAIVEELLHSEIEDKWKPMLEGFRLNAIIHLAEAASWLGMKAEVKNCLSSLEADQQYSISTDDAVRLAKGALRLTLNEFAEAVRQLEGQPQRRVELGSGEGAGKTGVILVLCYLELGQQANARSMRNWVLGEECPRDAGNRIAKKWLKDWINRFGAI